MVNNCERSYEEGFFGNKHAKNQRLTVVYIFDQVLENFFKFLHCFFEKFFETNHHAFFHMQK